MVELALQQLSFDINSIFQHASIIMPIVKCKILIHYTEQNTYMEALTLTKYVAYNILKLFISFVFQSFYWSDLCFFTFAWMDWVSVTSSDYRRRTETFEFLLHSDAIFFFTLYDFFVC